VLRRQWLGDAVPVRHEGTDAATDDEILQLARDGLDLRKLRQRPLPSSESFRPNWRQL
jgi:hypothetical protein